MDTSGPLTYYFKKNSCNSFMLQPNKERKTLLTSSPNSEVWGSAQLGIKEKTYMLTKKAKFPNKHL